MEGFNPPYDDEDLDRAKDIGWRECIAWFALLGPLNGHERINMNVLLEAEEANPYDEFNR